MYKGSPGKKDGFPSPSSKDGKGVGVKGGKHYSAKGTAIVFEDDAGGFGKGDALRRQAEEARKRAEAAEAEL